MGESTRARLLERNATLARQVEIARQGLEVIRDTSPAALTADYAGRLLVAMHACGHDGEDGSRR